jgi:hypothetical protein
VEDQRVKWEGHYIKDPVLFKAVVFALQMLSEGRTLRDAIGVSANHYKLKYSDVALELMVDKWLNKIDGPDYSGEDSEPEDFNTPEYDDGFAEGRAGRR